MIIKKIENSIIELFCSEKCAEVVSIEFGAGQVNWSRAYGNIRINFNDISVELSNIQEPTLCFGEMDDISGFACEVVDVDKLFSPYIDEDAIKVFVQKKIIGIEIIEDTINVNNGEYSIKFDDAIIFKMQDGVYMFSRDWQYGEIIFISKHGDYDSLNPISKIIDEWNNFGDYTVTVDRKIIVLK